MGRKEAAKHLAREGGGWGALREEKMCLKCEFHAPHVDKISVVYTHMLTFWHVCMHSQYIPRDAVMMSPAICCFPVSTKPQDHYLCGMLFLPAWMKLLRNLLLSLSSLQAAAVGSSLSSTRCSFEGLDHFATMHRIIFVPLPPPPTPPDGKK